MATGSAASNRSVAVSERTVSDAAAASSVSVATNSLSTVHQFVSIKLASRKFLFWRTQLVPFLRGQNLMGFVDGSLPCPSSSLPTASLDATSSTVFLQNLAFASWVQQDQAIMSMLISSFSKEVMHLAVGCRTSKEIYGILLNKLLGLVLGLFVFESYYTVLIQALASYSRARALNLLGQLQSLRQGDASVTDYLRRAQVILEDLALADQPVSIDKQNLYLFRGLRQEFRSLTASLSVRGSLVMLQELVDFCGES
ncbi:PREDICTED: uncharacterized protein LOC109155057 [Ipomoea nil]|uniref:uncharacterized protein LOC109155057 n=1 Tax=Ipomoea nil TaxID=35883 RepID=UPI000901413E|nr:PREDICTED: uncharacterized protein LOC109155057 [Ipomoea nil]